jgi:pimeloyl-ACP methyl ester carboxylesterase
VTAAGVLALASGGALHREGTAEGRPILFLHGVGGAAWSWLPQRAVFGAEHPVFVWEGRGHGAATHVADAGFADYLQDAREALAVVRGACATPPFIVGHSMGGLIATILAADGGPLRGLVLIDPVYAEDESPHVPAPLRALARFALRPFVRSAQRRGPLMNAVSRLAFRASFRDAAAAHYYWTFQRQQVPTEFPRMFEEGVSGVSDLVFRPWARDVTVPTLLINGRFPQLRAELRERLGPAFTDVTIPGGHYLQLDRPAAVNAALQRFFAATARREG